MTGIVRKHFLITDCSFCESLITFPHSTQRSSSFRSSPPSMLPLGGLKAIKSWYRDSLHFIVSLFFKFRQYKHSQFFLLFHIILNWESHICYLILGEASLRLTSVPTTIGLLAFISEILSWLCSLSLCLAITVVQWRKYTYMHIYTEFITVSSNMSKIPPNGCIWKRRAWRGDCQLLTVEV